MFKVNEKGLEIQSGDLSSLVHSVYTVRPALNRLSMRLISDSTVDEWIVLRHPSKNIYALLIADKYTAKEIQFGSLRDLNKFLIDRSPAQMRMNEVS